MTDKDKDRRMEDIIAEANQHFDSKNDPVRAVAAPCKELELLLLFEQSGDPMVARYIRQQLSIASRAIMGGIGMLKTHGLTIPTEDADNLKECYLGAMQDDLDELVPNKSIQQAAEDIADIVDSTVRKTRITANNEKYFNRDAHIDLMNAHAMMIAALQGLDTVPKDYEPDESSSFKPN